MKHLTDEDLILFHYRETIERLDRHDVESHLRACDACRAEYHAIERILSAVAAVEAPDRPAEYGAHVWARLQSRLERSPRRWGAVWMEWMAGVAAAPLVGVRELLRPRRLAIAGVVAALVLVAFIAGRQSRPPATQDAQAGVARGPERVRERILLVAIGEHLEASEMMLVELMNTPTGRVDISSGQVDLDDLVSANRLYRQAAAGSGDVQLATVLEDLERVLMDIANTPSDVSSAELDTLRQRIESQGLLFKIKIINSRVRAGQAPAAPVERTAS